MTDDATVTIRVTTPLEGKGTCQELIILRHAHALDDAAGVYIQARQHPYADIQMSQHTDRGLIRQILQEVEATLSEAPSFELYLCLTRKAVTVP